jgi:hypothetical protein
MPASLAVQANSLKKNYTSALSFCTMQVASICLYAVIFKLSEIITARVILFAVPSCCLRFHAPCDMIGKTWKVKEGYLYPKSKTFS